MDNWWNPRKWETNLTLPLTQCSESGNVEVFASIHFNICIYIVDGYKYLVTDGCLTFSGLMMSFGIVGESCLRW